MTPSTKFKPILHLIAFTLTVLLVVTLLPSASLEAQKMGKITPQLWTKTASGARIEFFVIMNQKADLSGAGALTGKAKTRYVYETLWDTAQRSQRPLKAWLDKAGIPYRAFYISNALLVEGDRDLVLGLAARTDVIRLEANSRFRSLDLPMQFPRPPSASPRIPKTVESNLVYVNADDVWAMGYTGQGIVIGGQDTGYDWDHPALIDHYRGWNGSAAFHDYNWHDSIHNSTNNSDCGGNAPEPCDDNNHGTHTMGTALGDDGAGNQIGMAPGAKWIGCRNMDEGEGTPATYLECFEFFLAPYPLGGTPADGVPELAPDVTVNSWSCPPAEGCAWDTLQAAIEAQRAAGIMTVVSAGNEGWRGCGTVDTPPGIYDAAYSIGALVKGSDSLASFSSRGPVTVDGSNRLKPDLAAPGTAIRSSIRGGAYGFLSGTSMAAPHVTGGVALLWSVVPNLSNNIEATEAYLNEGAAHLSATACNGEGWPNNLYGYGRLDILAAVQAARVPNTNFSHSTVLPNRPTTFINLTTGSLPITSTWNFGDGAIETIVGDVSDSIQHTYAVSGTYTVVLTAGNVFGQSTVTRTLTTEPAHSLYLPLLLK